MCICLSVQSAPVPKFFGYSHPGADASPSNRVPIDAAAFGLYYDGVATTGPRAVSVDYTVVEDYTPLVGVVQCWSSNPFGTCDVDPRTTGTPAPGSMEFAATATLDLSDSGRRQVCCCFFPQ
jgi:hypothetical protein